jgi:hypothetical protein
MKWGVFYFGICLFGQYWSFILQRLIVVIFRGDSAITFTEDFFLANKPKEYQNKALLIFNGFPAVLGIIFVSICLINPWTALAGYVFYITTTINPVKSLGSLIPLLAKLIKD